MINTIKIGFLGVVALISSWFGHPTQITPQTPPAAPVEQTDQLGAYGITGGGTYRLKSSISSTDSSVYLSSFKEPVSDQKYTMTYLNTTVGYGTIDPQTTRPEFISFSGINQNTDGSATLTGVIRGLTKTPQGIGCTASTTLAVRHPGQSIFILSDSPCHFAEYAVKRNDETISGSWTFSTPTASGNPATKTYVDNLVNGGTVSTDKVTVAAAAGETITQGQIVYFNQYTGQWLKAGADTASTSNAVMLGVAQGGGTSGQGISGGVLLRGLDSTNSGGTAGKIVYLSGTHGATSTSAGSINRPIGMMRSTSAFYFDPSSLTATSTYNLNPFTGDGSDGALSCSSGTTSINLGSATTTIKQYSSISITGTCKIAFTSPRTHGSVVVFKSQGDVTITSSNDPAIDLRSLGGAGGSAGATAATGTPGVYGDSWLSTPFGGLGGGGFAGTGTSLGVAGGTTTVFTNSDSNASGVFKYVIGAGGGGGGGGGSNGGSGGAGGAGGAGAGAFKLQVGGSLNFTGIIDASGVAGSAGSGSSGNGAGGGGGGGGGAGSVYIEYTASTAATGAIRIGGGSAGSGANGTSAGTSLGGVGGGGGASATSSLTSTTVGNGNGSAGTAGGNGVYFIGPRTN